MTFHGLKRAGCINLSEWSLIYADTKLYVHNSRVLIGFINAIISSMTADVDGNNDDDIAREMHDLSNSMRISRYAYSLMKHS